MPNKGYRKYTPEELKMLSRLYETMSLREVALLMGKTYSSVLYQKHQLGLTKSFAQRYTLHQITLTNVQLAYIAGIIDGEGTISVRTIHQKWKPTIRVSSTSRELIDWLTSTVVAPATPVQVRKASEHQALCYIWMIYGLSHLPTYEALEPYLVIKQRHMQLLIEFTRLRLGQSRDDEYTPRQLDIISEIRRLNIKPLHR